MIIFEFLIQLVQDVRVTRSSLETESKRMYSYQKMTGLFFKIEFLLILLVRCESLSLETESRRMDSYFNPTGLVFNLEFKIEK